jgi:hypothetical protein
MNPSQFCLRKGVLKFHEYLTVQMFVSPQTPGNKLVVILRENSHVHVHLNQALNEVQRSVMLVRPQIVNLFALFWNQLLQINSLGCTAFGFEKENKK